MKYVFKGKSKYSGQWCFGDLIQSKKQAWIIDPNYESDDDKIELGTCLSLEVAPETVRPLLECTDEEWLHCQVEKRGCEGCFYKCSEAEGENDGRCTEENL